jgi:hypothetical protein
MRKFRLLSACLLLVAIPVSAAQTKAPVDVKVRLQSGVLGQVIPVEIEVTNRTDQLLVVEGLQLLYRDKIVVPGVKERFTHLEVPAHEMASYSTTLLWNVAPLQTLGSEYYQDRIVFREAGVQPLFVRLFIDRGHWVEKPGSRYLVNEPFLPPMVVPFTVKVEEPRDEAELAWWELMRNEPAYAAFLERGIVTLYGDAADQMVSKLEQFVGKYPDHPLAATLHGKMEQRRVRRAKAGVQ